MVGLLTWPAYGTWFARPDRGWIDREGGEAGTVPEPMRSHTRARQQLKWPPIDLNRIVKIDKPTVRVKYELQEIGSPNFDELLARFLD